MKKVISVIFGMLVLASCSELTFTESVQQETAVATRSMGPAVEVLSLKSTSSSYMGYYSVYRKVIVRVQNLGFEKDLTIFGELEDGTWTELSRPGSTVYLGPAGEGYEKWQITASYTNAFGQKPFGDEMVVRYDVNGQTYWDNNDGANYTLAPSSGVQLTDAAQDVELDEVSFYPTNGDFFGLLDVKNLTPSKAITIVYTYDNWETVLEAPAEYVPYYVVSYGNTIPSPNEYGVERWRFYIESPEDVDPATINKSDVQFAIHYDFGNGNEGWNNNYGRNFGLF